MAIDVTCVGTNGAFSIDDVCWPVIKGNRTVHRRKYWPWLLALHTASTGKSPCQNAFIWFCRKA